MTRIQKQLLAAGWTQVSEYQRGMIRVVIWRDPESGEEMQQCQAVKRMRGVLVAETVRRSASPASEGGG